MLQPIVNKALLINKISFKVQLKACIHKIKIPKQNFEKKSITYSAI